MLPKILKKSSKKKTPKYIYMGNCCQTTFLVLGPFKQIRSLSNSYSVLFLLFSI